MSIGILAMTFCQTLTHKASGFCKNFTLGCKIKHISTST
uniref:Uncharacterized protein n=1 Tax=Lepeophtheirus salmonis TaxID=72036 RepID=A0A0K2V5E2_LEPSM